MNAKRRPLLTEQPARKALYDAVNSLPILPSGQLRLPAIVRQMGREYGMPSPRRHHVDGLLPRKQCAPDSSLNLAISRNQDNAGILHVPFTKKHTVDIHLPLIKDREVATYQKNKQKDVETSFKCKNRSDAIQLTNSRCVLDTPSPDTCQVSRAWIGSDRATLKLSELTVHVLEHASCHQFTLSAYQMRTQTLENVIHAAKLHTLLVPVCRFKLLPHGVNFIQSVEITFNNFNLTDPRILIYHANGNPFEKQQWADKTRDYLICDKNQKQNRLFLPQTGEFCLLQITAEADFLRKPGSIFHLSRIITSLLHKKCLKCTLTLYHNVEEQSVDIMLHASDNILSCRSRKVVITRQIEPLLCDKEQLFMDFFVQDRVSHTKITVSQQEIATNGQFIEQINITEIKSDRIECIITLKRSMFMLGKQNILYFDFSI